MSASNHARGLLLGFTIVASGVAFAVDPVNTTRRGVAIDGHDPVAYFEFGEPREGVPEHAFDWQGATWRFASAAHRDLFAADPARYAPQYGGYCAWAVAQGTTAGIDPEAWRIVDGKLYLNYSPKIQRRWAENVPGHIEAADRHWPRLLGRD